MDPLTLGMLAVVGVAFYFLMIRPQKARQKAQRDMIAALGPGARIMTTAGVFGTIAERTDSEVRLEIAPGVVIAIVPEAIAKVVEPAIADSPVDGE